MNTPKSQNPEGKVVVVGYIRPEALAALNACRNDEHNGCAYIWMRPVNADDVPLIPATTLAVMQRRLEAVIAAGKALDDAMDMQEKRESGGFHITMQTAWGIWDDARTAWRTLLRDGKGDGVSTAEGEGK